MAATPSSDPAARGHALTLGCTGMLAGAARSLAADGYTVSYLSRRGQLPRDCHGAAYACDWSDPGSVEAAVRQAVEAQGTPSIALVWTHEIGQALALARCLAAPSRTLRFHHVLGSAVSDPARKDTLSRVARSFSALPGMDWRAIYLGFKIEGAHARWLTHDEICAGAYEAVRLAAPIYTIGQTRPWSRHP